MADRRTLQCACVVVMLLALCVGIPRQAGPDEPAHTIRAAALVRGQVFGEESGLGDAYRTFEVPAWVAQPDPGCFAFRPEQSAGCATVDLAATGDAELPSSAAAYPIFGQIVPGLGTLLTGSARALWLARVLNAALCAALVCAAFVRLRRLAPALYRSVMAATLLALTPAALFSMSVINPSGPTCAGVVAVAAALWAPSRDRSRIDWLLAAGACAVALPRSDGWFWLVVVVMACGFARRLGPRQIIAEIGRRDRVVLGTALTISLAWAVAIRPELVPVPTDLHGSALLSRVLQRTTDHLDEGVGLFGWADTDIPAFASYLWWATVGALLMAAHLQRRSRAIWVAAGALAGFVLIGWCADLVSAGRVGLVWQGRYALPILIVGVMALGQSASRTGVTAAVGERYTSAVGLIAVTIWIVGFFQALRRWSVGADGPLSPFNWVRGGSAFHPGLCLVVFALASIGLWAVTFGVAREVEG